jgi:hypothetical protein
MTKNMKLALLPAAVTAALLSGNAMAGTEACIEVYRAGAADAGLTEIFKGSDCAVDRTGATDTTLAPLDQMEVAYELTGGNDFDLNDVKDASQDMRVVYVPTSNLSPSTTIAMKLSDNAVFGDNGNLLHLVIADNAGKVIAPVASTDRAVNAQNEILFIVRDTPIEAGSRLVISRTSTAGELVSAPVVTINNTDCPEDSNVAISVPRVRINSTDGVNGLPVEGGETKSPTVLINAQRQFDFLTSTVAATKATVDSQPDALLTQFELVVDADGNVIEGGANPWLDKTTDINAVYDNTFVNRASDLDAKVVLNAGDRVGMQLALKGGAATNVLGSLHINPTVNGPVLDATAADHLDAAAELVDVINNTTDFYPVANSTVIFDANEVFPGQGEFNGALNLTGNGSEMGYHYETSSNFAIFFANAEQRKLLNQQYACNDTVTTHDVDVNGAVLKVPYALNSGGNWVRISNESGQPASVIVTVFDENEGASQIFEPVTVVLDPATFGELEAYDSIKVDIPKVMTQVRRETGLQHSSRVTLTFTVTAPADQVHAVSVLNTGGAVDRTMPVLDQNSWNQ